jgi:anti-sigma factor RsiW
MTCPRKDVELFTRRASGRLDQAEAEAVETHLRGCTECRATAEAQRAVWNALDEWPAAPVSDDFDRRLMARIEAEAATPWWRSFSEVLRHVSWKSAIPVAAACAAIFAIFLLQSPATHTPRQKPVDIEQVESALDDVDMLNQLGAAVPVQPSARAQSGT